MYKTLLHSKILPNKFKSFCSFYRLNFCNKINKNNNIGEEKENFCFTDSNILKPGSKNNDKQDFSNLDASNFKITKSNPPTVIIDSIKSKSSFKKDFLELTKFKLCILNSFVSLTTYTFYCTNQTLLDYCLFGLGTMSISMTTQVLNQLWEKIHDKEMKRTMKRPLPKQRMSDKTALIIAISLWSSSTILYSLTCPSAILFSNFILALYIFGYTPMKRVSNLSMHLGALVGALPALLGSFAATNILFLNEALLLAGYIFSWQYPHFYGILYQNKEDYKKAGFMFISRSEEKTKYAYMQMIVAMGAMAYIVYLFNKKGIMNNISTTIFYTFFAYNLIPVLKFINNPTHYAKIIRVRSYTPFMIVLISFLVSIKSQKRLDKIDEVDSSNVDSFNLNNKVITEI